jgi:hypothetical protein
MKAGQHPSVEAIERMRIGQLGRKHPKSVKEKIRIALTGRKRTNEQKARMSASQKGYKVPDERKERISRTMKQNYSLEHREAVRKAHIGKKHSPETKEKMRQSALGRKNTPDHTLKVVKAFAERKAKGIKNRNWKGQKIHSNTGYIWIEVFDHPHASAGRILEHRLIMENILGRYLERWEHVHHKNCIKDDNRPENLEIVLSYKHHGEIRCPHCLKQFKIK